jgi:hypothetical protein
VRARVCVRLRMFALSADELPTHVRTFLNEYAGSLEELGILLALLEVRARWWDAGSMATRAGLTRPTTRRVLEAFASRNLLEITISDDIRYRLRAGTPELARNIDAVAGVYGRAPMLVLRWAMTRARHRMAGFAEAFMIGKDGLPG